MLDQFFQGRFKSKLIEKEEYFLQLSRYIHQNPLELVPQEKRFSKLRVFLRHYPFSSYQFYLDLRKKSWINTRLISKYFSQTMPTLSYREFVESPILAGEIEKN